MKNLIRLSLLGVVALMLACTNQVPEKSQPSEPAVEAPVIDASKTEAVLGHHFQAFQENDLEAIMEDYAEDAIVILPDSTYVGTEQIRGLFTGLFQAFPTEGTSITLDKMEIQGELAYVIWHGSSPVFDVPLGSDTFIITDGKIQRQSFVGMLNPVAEETEEG